ncbi:hypothetical protein [Virgibacillus halodenitrificans]|uniref:hypothetical protein n=1 Tax=Virgibacillus halodenitrificans TaxID=1482 RepID=UPI0013CE964E|nr:hypothetical protein [Virgibacillus halodenitrificans]
MTEEIKKSNLFALIKAKDDFLEKELRKIKEIGMGQYKKERINNQNEIPVWK